MYIDTLEVAGFIPALQGMRNPMDSWEKGDTKRYSAEYFEIGENDMKLAKNLIKAGTEHCKFLRQIQVWANINMPRYWWSEFDTYHFNTKNSCSTMHKLFREDREIDIHDFMFNQNDRMILSTIVRELNSIRTEWLLYKDMQNNEMINDCLVRAKRILPEGFLQLRTVNTNYAELMSIYHQRKHHRLKEEWIDIFCKWCESLPYFKELCIDK